MFWGLILKANKKYSQTVTKSFHVSCAALDQSTVTTNDDVQVMLVSDDNAYLLCTLRKGSICQVPLDLNFAEGDKISFSTKGNGIVHLTGYLIPEGEDFGMDDSDSDEGEGASAELEKLMGKDANGKKAKAEKSKKVEAANAKKDDSDSDEDEEEDDEDDDDEGGEAEEGEGSDDEMEFEDAESEEEDSDDDEEADSDEEVKEPKSKVQKLDKKEKAKQNGVANGKEAPAKEGKKDKKAAAAQQTPAPEKGQKRVLPGGVVVEELRVGTGMEAKNGKKVQVYYEGRLKTNNKVFDSTKSGPGFKFGLGKGDVIKGWDLGVVGMKVGGKRRLTCPPAVAYGAKGSPPVIPPNSTLVFDVELKNVF